jgi:AbrB family looped-hinge helix DNA binding protein
MKCDIEFYGSATVGERGQVVIPKEAREELGLAQGENLLVFRAPFGNGFLVVKPDAFEQHVQRMSQFASDLQEQITKELRKK